MRRPMSNGLFGLRRRVLLSFLLRLLLLSLGLIRKNERGLAGTHQLQLLANLQLLRGRIFLQLLNAVAPILILALQIGVVFFERANLAPLLAQRRQALRSSQ